MTELLCSTGNIHPVLMRSSALLQEFTAVCFSLFVICCSLAACLFFTSAACDCAARMCGNYMSCCVFAWVIGVYDLCACVGMNAAAGNRSHPAMFSLLIYTSVPGKRSIAIVLEEQSRLFASFFSSSVYLSNTSASFAFHLFVYFCCHLFFSASIFT